MEACQSSAPPQLGGRGQGEAVRLHWAPKPWRQPRARPPRQPSGGGGGGQRAIDGCPQMHRTLCGLPRGSLQLLQSLSPAGLSPPWLGSVPRSRGGTGTARLGHQQPGTPGGPSPISQGHSAPEHPPQRTLCQHLCSSCFPGPSPGKHRRLLLFLPSNNIFPAQNNIGKAVGLLILFQARLALLPSPGKFLLRLALRWHRAPSPSKKHPPAMPPSFPQHGGPPRSPPWLCQRHHSNSGAP